MSDQVRDLHAAIMNLPWGAMSCDMTPTERMGYSAGHRDARHAAAELAASHAAEVEAMREALKAMDRLLDRDACINGKDILLPCESHDQAFNFLGEARELVRAALKGAKE